LSTNTHHAASSVQRYIKSFVQVVHLHQNGMSDIQIGLLLQMGEALVKDYLNVYENNAQPECRRRLEEQVTRLCGHAPAEKGAQ
jgi:predicted transcriptional regulator